MTRTYERQIIKYSRSAIDQLEAEGRAVYFPGLPGYVLDKKIPVRNHQILEDEAPFVNHSEDPDAAYERFLETRYADEHRAEEAVERANGALDHYEAAAAAAGVSVGEYTDGEYGSFGPDSAEEDALLAKFGL